MTIPSFLFVFLSSCQSIRVEYQHPWNRPSDENQSRSQNRFTRQACIGGQRDGKGGELSKGGGSCTPPSHREGKKKKEEGRCGRPSSSPRNWSYLPTNVPRRGKTPNETSHLPPSFLSLTRSQEGSFPPGVSTTSSGDANRIS